MVTVKERKGNGTIRISLSQESLDLLNAKYTKRKRGKAIETMILEKLRDCTQTGGDRT